MCVLFPAYTEETIMFDKCQEGDRKLDVTNHETTFETKISVGYIFYILYYYVIKCTNIIVIIF